MKGAEFLLSFCLQKSFSVWLLEDISFLVSLTIPHHHPQSRVFGALGPGSPGVVSRSDETTPWAAVVGWILSPMTFTPRCYSCDYATYMAKGTLQMWWRLRISDLKIGRLSGQPNLITSLLKTDISGFPGGAVVENLPANAGDTGSSPGLGRSHMPRSN